MDVDSEEKRPGHDAPWRQGEEGGSGALGSLAKKKEEIRYLQRKSLQTDEGSRETVGHLNVAATSQEGSDCGWLMIRHIFWFSNA